VVVPNHPEAQGLVMLRLGDETSRRSRTQNSVIRAKALNVLWMNKKVERA
jgi:hypothetical protein